MNAPMGSVAAAAPRQRGVALIVALVLLVVATLIGLAASRGTTLQERMSGNTSLESTSEYLIVFAPRRS